MPGSKQTPLISPRGKTVNDFAQSYPDWEATVFDNACHYAVIKMKARDEERLYKEFEFFPWAVRYALQIPKTCIYAVVESGRFTQIDRSVWPEWETRWWQNWERKMGCHSHETAVINGGTMIRRK